jgi:hypothetical protein
MGALILGCAPTTNIGWQKKVAKRIHYADKDDIEIVKVIRYRDRLDRRDMLNEAEGIFATSQYGIGLDQNFSRDGKKEMIMVKYKHKGMSKTYQLLFDGSGVPMQKKRRW